MSLWKYYRDAKYSTVENFVDFNWYFPKKGIFFVQNLCAATMIHYKIIQISRDLFSTNWKNLTSWYAKMFIQILQ